MKCSRTIAPGCRARAGSAALRARAALWLFAALCAALAACRPDAPPTREDAGPAQAPPDVPRPGPPPPMPDGAADIPALVAAVEPAVVNVMVERYAVQQRPFDDFGWPFDFGIPPGRGGRRPREEVQRLQARGSGFIVDPAGHVITNAHVIAGAEAVRVRLLDRREVRATVVGLDRHLDLAVLTLERADRLPVVRLGSSEASRVGEAVVAIGNPFGLGHTVTTGIISAKSRAIGAGPYDDFLQTDAAINPGNSGGPLFNVKGEVVGINTAIAAQGSGIGFAIPIDSMKDVLSQLLRTGRIERGRLGAGVQELDWNLAQALGLERPEGALVTYVEEGSPAARAGLREKDVIVAVGGERVETGQELPRLVARHRPGERVSLQVARGGQPMNLDVTLGRLEQEPPARREPARPTAPPTGPLGLRVADARGGGAVVLDVGLDAPAGAAIQEGDVILQVNDRPIAGARDLVREVQAAPEDAPLLLKLRRGEVVRYAAIPPRR